MSTHDDTTPRCIPRKIRFLGLFAVALGIFPTFSNAEVWATGPVWGGAAQTNVVCYVFNANVAAIDADFVSLEVRGEANRNMLISARSCGSSLAPGQICFFIANVPNNSAFSCRVVTNGPFIHALRGSIEVRGNTGTLSRADMLH